MVFTGNVEINGGVVFKRNSVTIRCYSSCSIWYGRSLGQGTGKSCRYYKSKVSDLGLPKGVGNSKISQEELTF